MGYVIADSPFYILFYGELEDKDSLYYILEKYKFIIGDVIKKEIKKHISKDKRFKQLINDISTNINYVTLLKDFYDHILREFPQMGAHISDGEYEAIGLSYLLKQNDDLEYLIMDDKSARKFVEQKLTTIKSNLVWTPNFLYCGYSKDRTLDKEFVERVLWSIKQAILNGKKPLYLTENT